MVHNRSESISTISWALTELNIFFEIQLVFNLTRQADARSSIERFYDGIQLGADS